MPQPILFDMSRLLAVQAIDYSNMTVQNITEKYVPSAITNSSSVANSAFFLVYLSIFLVFLSTQIARSRKHIVRNQLILYIIVIMFIAIYMFALVFRLIYNGLGLYINLNFKNIDKPSIIQYQKVLWASGCIENFVSFFQMIPIGIFILSFIQYVFLTTVRKAGAMSKLAYRIIIGSVIVVTIISFILSLGLSIANALVNLLKKTGDLKMDVTPIYASLFIIYILIAIFQIVIFVLSGIRLIQTIRKNRIKSNIPIKQSFIEKMNSPYTKILLIVTGALLSMGLLMLSVIFSIVTSLYLPNYHIIDYFLHGLGIAVFSGFVAFTYSPYWAKKANNEKRSSVVSTSPHSPLESIPTDNLTTPSTPTLFVRV